MVDVMFYEMFKEEETAIKKYLPGNIRAQYTWKTIQEHGDKTAPSALISIRTQSCIPKSWAKEINGILARSQGYDHLLAFRREFGTDISYGYLENYCARAVAEQAILVMMALLRKLKNQISSFNDFAREGLTGLECRGRNVLVVGVGHIGSEVVDIAKGLRMNVKGHDIEQKIKNLAYVPLDEGIAWADIVFCALPLTKETDGMLDYRALQKGNPGLIFINIARGEISPAEDLVKLLDEKILGGVGLDVYSQEPVLAHCLRSNEKNKAPSIKMLLDFSKKGQVIFTPHNAFNTKEALEQKASLSADAVVSFLERRTFPCPIPPL